MVAGEVGAWCAECSPRKVGWRCFQPKSPVEFEFELAPRPAPGASRRRSRRLRSSPSRLAPTPTAPRAVASTHHVPPASPLDKTNSTSILGIGDNEAVINVPLTSRITLGSRNFRLPATSRLPFVSVVAGRTCRTVEATVFGAAFVLVQEDVFLEGGGEGEPPPARGGPCHPARPLFLFL